jgi:tol-pal system protein YbgF
MDGNRVATGSGFIIDPNGIIVTNYHVISKWLEADNTILFKMENGAFYPIEDLISFDVDNDIALVKVTGKELPTIKLAKDYKPKQGEGIVVIGSPLGLETTVSDGIISSMRGKEGLIQITAPISPGSSGSPVFNSKGEVIGIATLFVEGGQNLNFAIPVSYITTLIEESKKPKKKIMPVPLPEAPAPAPKPQQHSPEDIDITAKKHHEAILNAHPDFGKTFTKNDVIAWIDEMPQEYRRKAYMQIVQNGTAEEVIQLLTEFKASKWLDKKSVALTPGLKNKKAIYDAAYNAFEKGRYKEAREQFEVFIKEFPQDELTDNAQFWIAETYYREEDFKNAILAYEEVLKKYPKSKKVPGALLKQGVAFIELGDNKTGKVILEKLMESYPGSKQAELAKKKIEEIEKKTSKKKK